MSKNDISRPQATSGYGSATRRGPAAQAGRARRLETPLFEIRCSARVSTKTNKKERPTGWLVFPEIARLRTRFYFFILVDFPSREIGKIKKRFRHLRMAAKFHLDGPGCAPGLRRVADPDPLVACGRE